jgi:hypothetical protein
MKPIFSEIEMLEPRVAPAVLFSVTDPQVNQSPVFDYASSPTLLPALTPSLPAIIQSPVIDLMQDSPMLAQFNQIGSVLPPLNLPNFLASSTQPAGGTLLFGSFR